MGDLPARRRGGGDDRGRVQGFRGWAQRFWKREDEVEFPNWMTEGVEIKPPIERQRIQRTIAFDQWERWEMVKQLQFLMRSDQEAKAEAERFKQKRERMIAEIRVVEQNSFL